jgi:predicted nucleotidyltransferase
MQNLVLIPQQRKILERVAAALCSVRGITAIGLGGSHARGRARPDSDLDICLLYSSKAAFDVAEIRSIAARLDHGGSPVVAGLGEWGPWVDGGAWLVIDEQRVDFLYRAEEKVEAVLADAHAGRFESHFDQQPPFGYFGPTLLGEIATMKPLSDPAGRLASLQARVMPFPAALRQTVVQHGLWSVEFGLTAFVPKYVVAGTTLSVAGCLTRFGQALVLTLFALNGRYFLNDKTALTEIEEFAICPVDFGDRLTALLATIGNNPDELARTVAEFRRLFAEVRDMASGLYQPYWSLEALTA